MNIVICVQYCSYINACQCFSECTIIPVENIASKRKAVGFNQITTNALTAHYGKLNITLCVEITKNNYLLRLLYRNQCVHDLTRSAMQIIL